MTARDATTAFAAAFVDEWARAGVTDAVVAPGSRSAPLALALAADARVRVHVLLDERSAAFFALGLARASGRPAVVCCTSGTAAANLHPAVAEAAHGRVPLLVCTANRPPELHDTGAGQTIDQTGMFGAAVRWFVQPGPPVDVPGAGVAWRSVASRAAAEACGPPAGPVHLDLMFREPLVPAGAPLVDAPGRPGGAPWTASTRAARLPDRATVDALAARVAASPRGLLVAGWGAGVDAATVERFARAARWPVLADPISGVRCGPHAVSTYDALLRVPGFAGGHRPGLVLRVGAALTSKVASAWLDPSVPQVAVDPDGAWLDPHRAAGERLAVDAAPLLDAVAAALAPRGPGEAGWCGEWLAAERLARAALDECLDAGPGPDEGRAARDLVASLPDGALLGVASSLPVREVEWFAAPRGGVAFLANRGANGIDGFVSTVLGAAAAAAGPVTGLLGDLCFLHDVNGLLGPASRDVDAVLVVLDNDGGGIFSFLPQHGHPEFERLFGTPHGLDLVAVASAYGVPARRVGAAEVAAAATEARADGGVHVLVVPVDRAGSPARHAAAWDAVATALARR